MLIHLVDNALRHFILQADYVLQKYIDNNTMEKHLPCVLILGAHDLQGIVKATHTSILWMLRLIFNMQSPLGYLYSSNQHGTVHQN